MQIIPALTASAFSCLFFTTNYHLLIEQRGEIRALDLSRGYRSSLNTQYSINLAWHLCCLSGSGQGKHVKRPQVGSLDLGCGRVTNLASFGKLSFVSNSADADVSQWTLLYQRSVSSHWSCVANAVCLRAVSAGQIIRLWEDLWPTALHLSIYGRFSIHLLLGKELQHNAV